jgi:hypothetical protein
MKSDENGCFPYQITEQGGCTTGCWRSHFSELECRKGLLIKIPFLLRSSLLYKYK